jgi:hypothetical protein
VTGGVWQLAPTKMRRVETGMRPRPGAVIAHVLAVTLILRAARPARLNFREPAPATFRRREHL